MIETSTHIDDFLLVDDCNKGLLVIKERALDNAIQRGEFQNFKVHYVEVWLKKKVLNTKYYEVKVFGELINKGE